MISQAHTTTTLVRYGQVPEVARFDPPGEAVRVERGDRVVVRTHHGLQLGTLLEEVPDGAAEDVAREPILRRATEDDLRRQDDHQRECELEFAEWQTRISDWDLDLQLVDLERTLDGEKLIFYVLNERGPECTKLALQAAAGGFGIIAVQPIDADGTVQAPESSGGGCGSGGCGCG